MSTKVEATIEDLYKVDGKAELVNGEIVYMSPTGKDPHYAAWDIANSLRAYSVSIKNAYAVCDNVGFVVDLPHRKSFSPDAAFFVGANPG
jgi:Uma2 family endonuclease